MKLVLDTNLYCDYTEGIPNVVDYVPIPGEDIFLPSIVIAELTTGFTKESRRNFNERKLQVEIVDVNQIVARKYVLVYLSLVKKVTKIPINDVWIAACCMEVGGTLSTRDCHLAQVDQIEAMVLDT